MFNMLLSAAPKLANALIQGKRAGQRASQLRRKNSAKQTKVVKRVTAPVAMATERTFAQAQVTTRGGVARVRHSELVGPIIGSVNYQNFDALIINPGLKSVFPWLSTIASSYEEYLFNNLYFVYEPTVSTGSPGFIMLSPNYDATSNTTGLTEQQISNTEGTQSFNVWTDSKMQFNIKTMNASTKRRYVRDCNVAGDRKLYDAALLNVAASQAANGNQCGRLWVYYDVSLYIPRTAPTICQPSQTSSFVTLIAQALVSNTLTPVVFNPATTPSSMNPLQIVWSGGNTIFTLPKGCYRLIFTGILQDVANEASSGYFAYSVNGVLVTPGNVPNCIGHSADYVSPNGPMKHDMIVTAVVSVSATDALSVNASITAGTGPRNVLNGTLLITMA